MSLLSVFGEPCVIKRLYFFAKYIYEHSLIAQYMKRSNSCNKCCKKVTIANLSTTGMLIFFMLTFLEENSVPDSAELFL